MATQPPAPPHNLGLVHRYYSAPHAIVDAAQRTHSPLEHVERLTGWRFALVWAFLGSIGGGCTVLVVLGLFKIAALL